MPEFLDELDFPFDIQSFSVTLLAGRTYYIEMKGSATGAGTLPDPALSLVFDTNNQLIGQDSNGGVGANARFVFTATPGAHDTIRPGDGALAFEGAGAATGSTSPGSTPTPMPPATRHSSLAAQASPTSPSRPPAPTRSSEATLTPTRPSSSNS